MPFTLGSWKVLQPEEGVLKHVAYCESEKRKSHLINLMELFEELDKYY